MTLNRQIKVLGLGLAAALVVFLNIGPLLWQGITSLKLDRDLNTLPPILPREVTFDHYANVFHSVFVRFIANSAIVAFSVTAISLLLGSMAAYAIARLPIKGKSLWLGLFLATSMFPQIAIIAPLYAMIRKIGLYNTHAGLALSYMLFCLPLCVWLLYGFFKDLPAGLEEAAAADGCGPVRTFWQIALPLAMPGLVTAGLLVFIASWNEFLIALTLTNKVNTQTIPVGIALFPQMFYVPWGDVSAASVVVTLPLVALVLLFENKLAKGLTGGAVKG
ncbi:carbohydrate ABC transporter permease [Cohnella laeviribosi]|uniref:carbohydrate ABC transporter permease n=1 Tax=Cohnella laeviribosi TaxID=380174 RepID=UPI003D2253E6